MHGISRNAVSAVAAMVTLAACGGTANNASGTSTSGSAMQPVDLKIMVGGLNKQIYLPNMLAKQLGYFDQEKINVTLVDEGSGQGTELEVVAGNVDAGSGAYSHPVELNALGKKIETICQFGIAPGEAEMVASSKAGSIKSAADLKGKKLGVTDIGSGTHTISLALLGKAGYGGTFFNVSFVGTQALADELGRESQGIMISQVMPFPFSTTTAISREYLDAVRKAGGDARPNYSSMEGYLAAKVLDGTVVLERVHRFDDDEIIDRLSEKYTGAPFPMRSGTVYLIEPERTGYRVLPFAHRPPG